MEQVEITQTFIDEWNRIRAKVDGMSGPGVVNSLGGISFGGNDSAPDVSPHDPEWVLVRIIGTETGGGYYKGSIVRGVSNGGAGDLTGSNPPATYNFQLQNAGQTQTQTDQPQLVPVSGSYVNNALVVNVNEPYLTGTHMLFGTSSMPVFVWGRVQGVTKETKPRTIVYVESWPLFPVIAKITAQYGTSPRGIYYGKLAQGQFATGSNASAPAVIGLGSSFFATSDNCWINNIWENVYSTSSAGLPANTYVLGFATGFPFGGPPTAGSNTVAQVYTMTPIQSATLTHTIQNIVTAQTANSSYGINEQTMMNNLKTDVSNLQAALSNLYANLKAAGYSL